MLNCGVFEFSGYDEVVALWRILMVRYENFIVFRFVIYCSILIKVDIYDKVLFLNIF